MALKSLEKKSLHFKLVLEISFHNNLPRHIKMFVFMTLTKFCAHKIQMSAHHHGLPPLNIKGES